MMALSLPITVLLAVGIRPLVAGLFGYTADHLDMVTWCTWAFLIGLLGDTWLETAVRSFYANQDTRTPLIAAAIQAVVFFCLAWLLARVIGLPGIPLAAATTFTIQAIVLQLILNRKFPGLLNMTGTLPRALIASTLGGLVAWVGIRFIPFSQLPATLVAIASGLIISLLIIRKDLGLLFRL
jgi:putative peptidoglycan lipid II flippase